jgi:hypothetical protein
MDDMQHKVINAECHLVGILSKISIPIRHRLIANITKNNTHVIKGWNGHPWIPTKPVKIYNMHAFTQLNPLLQITSPVGQ